MSNTGPCKKKLVSGEKYSISDNYITASTYSDKKHAPKRSRLNTIEDAGGA